MGVPGGLLVYLTCYKVTKGLYPEWIILPIVSNMTGVYPGDQEKDAEDDGGRVQQSKLNKKTLYFIKFSSFFLKILNLYIYIK